MIAQFSLLVFATSCAFVMGFATNQGSTCAVAAAKQIVLERRATKLAGFGAAAGAAGLVCLPLAWIVGSAAKLPGETRVTGELLLGAILLGLGAVVNDACLFGTLSRIGRGEVRFLALPVGLALGFGFVERQTFLTAPALTQSVYARPSVAGVLVVLAAGVLLLMTLRLLASHAGRTDRPGRWPLRRAMVVLGVTGALLFALTPDWTYADALRRSVAPTGATAMIGVGALFAGAAAVGGAVFSGVITHSFRFQRPTFGLAARSLVGGMIMAVGATLIPGGNDSLLLAAVPAGTLRGVAAFSVMLITVVALTVLRSRRRTLPIG